jgi:RNA polymerase sigma-70 factor (ECF subfamily)
MFGIIRNAWIDNRRAHRRESAVLTVDDAAGDVPDPAQGSLHDRLSIESALQRLPEEQQLAVSLVLVEGLSYAEAAEVMQVPVGTLTSRLSRGRDALARMLARTEPT